MPALAPAEEGPGAVLDIVEGELVALVVYLVAVDDVVDLAQDALEDEVPVVFEQFCLLRELFSEGRHDKFLLIPFYPLLEEYLHAYLVTPGRLIRCGFVRAVLEIDPVGRLVA